MRLALGHIGTLGADGTPAPVADPVVLTMGVIDTRNPLKCPLWQREVCDYGDGYLTNTMAGPKCECATTPTSLISMPGRLIGQAAGKVFPKSTDTELEFWGHVVTGVLILGGTIYAFTKK